MNDEFTSLPLTGPTITNDFGDVASKAREKLSNYLRERALAA